MTHWQSLVPEFDNKRSIGEINGLIYERKIRYDIILGADFLAKAGMVLDYEKYNIRWFENEIPLRDPNQLDHGALYAMADLLEVQHEDEFIGEEWIDSMFANPILDAKYHGCKYDKADLPLMVSKMSHLDMNQKK